MNRLQSALNNPIHDRKRLADEYAITSLISAGVQEMAAMHKMNAGQCYSAVVQVLVSLVQSKAPPEEWAEVGLYLGESIMRRLTVKQD